MVVHSQGDRLIRLLSESWGSYDRLREREFVVRPAIPILFFGDSNRYLSSPLKVVTVGLNPSKVEFPDDDRFRRFPAARNARAGSDEGELRHHLEALNAYFRTDPYRSWFASYEPILNGLGASYYDGGQPSTAVHTDICSPIATDPTWRGLANEEKSLLVPDGLALWHSLVEALAPDVILISVAKEHLNRIKFPIVGSPRVIWRLDRQRPYEVVGTLHTVTLMQSSLLVFGRAANKPFGTILNTDKVQIGAAIKEHFGAR